MSNPYLSRVLSSGREVFLVGGYLRDLVRSVQSKDIDFLMRGDLSRLVPRLFPKEVVTIIEFKKGLLLRVIAGKVVMDFTELKGSLEDDIKRRDFTMNALAWSAGDGMIDLVDGLNDIRKRRIRALSERNFHADPLRLLRAYRFSGELGWEIEAGTRRRIRGLKHLIASAATERTTLEVLRLLNSQYYLKAIKRAEKDGLLTEILSIRNERLRRNIKALSRFDSFLKKLPEQYKKNFKDGFSQEVLYIGLLRAEQLLYGSDLCKGRLSLSRSITNRITRIADALRDYETCSRKEKMDDSRLFSVFSSLEEASADFAFLTRRHRYVEQARRFMHLKSLLPLDQIRVLTGLDTGPELGSAIFDLKRQQFLRRVMNRSDAYAYVRKRFSGEDR